MLPNPQFPANLVTFKEEILNGKLHFSAVLGNTSQSMTYRFYLNSILYYVIQEMFRFFLLLKIP